MVNNKLELEETRRLGEVAKAKDDFERELQLAEKAFSRELEDKKAEWETL